MDAEKLVDAINEMGDCTAEQILARAKARKSVESRLAAVIWSVAGSQLPVATAALEIIMDLTMPNWETDIGDPLATPVGKYIVNLARTPPNKRKELDETEHRTATRLLELAEDPAAITDDVTDQILRMSTGKDMSWWLNWIRRNRLY
jgi:hypothetical protein